jgi:uncharacterized lipoprotein YmbA
MRWMTMLVMAAALAGCGSEKLDTGYMPRKLGASDALRRSYYAAPFSPESKVPERDRVDFEKNRARTY